MLRPPEAAAYWQMVTLLADLGVSSVTVPMLGCFGEVDIRHYYTHAQLGTVKHDVRRTAFFCFHDRAESD